MPVETWFPSVVFYQDYELEPQLRADVLAAVEEKSAALVEATGGRVTASDASNDLHLDPRIAALFGVFAPALKDFLFTDLGIDSQGTEFYIGRCWPVVQDDGEFSGGAHMHSGAVFSGVFYLQVPDGAGPLQFTKPYRSSYDGFDKTDNNALNYLATEYPPIENRLIVFSSDLVHQRLSNSGVGQGRRIAISFDLYSMVDIDMKGGGMPHFELLRRLV